MAADESDPFTALVLADARDEAAPNQSEWLRQPEQVGHWVTTLTDIVRDLMHQSSSLNEEEELDKVAVNDGMLSVAEMARNRADRATRKRRMARFRRGIESKLSEAKRLSKESNMHRTNSEDHEMRYRYRKAIQQHRDASSAGDYEPTEFDLDLWNVLTEEPT